MTLRDLLFELLDAGVNDLDTELIFYSEKETEHGSAALQHDHIDIAKNGNCLQLFLYNEEY